MQNEKNKNFYVNIRSSHKAFRSVIDIDSREGLIELVFDSFKGSISRCQEVMRVAPSFGD